MSDTFFVFDVESVGLHGEGYAVGYVVVNGEGRELESGCFACNPIDCCGPISGRKWVAENAPPLAVTHGSAMGVRAAFWNTSTNWKARGAVLAADCAWPVEARFLCACVDDARPINRGGMADGRRDWEGPYPLIDVASVALAAGQDPLGTNDREPSELPTHNPLADARQSARLLLKWLGQLKETEENLEWWIHSYRS